MNNEVVAVINPLWRDVIQWRLKMHDAAETISEVNWQIKVNRAVSRE
jgi:hypothetical protein